MGAARAQRKVVVPRGEAGVSGTTRWHGQLMTEPTTKLQHRQAFGAPGQRGWGYWEAIHRTDPAVAAAIDFHLGPIRDSRLEVVPAEGVPNAQAHADFVRWVLLQKVSPGWSALLNEFVVGKLRSGFALHEECWDEVVHPTLPGGRGEAIVKLAQRLPSSLEPNCWNEDAHGLKSVTQQGVAGNAWKRIDLPAEKLLLQSWQREGDNYAGYSAFRSVSYLAEVRAAIVKLPGVALMREAVGIPVATGAVDAPDLSEEQEEELATLLSRMQAHENAYLYLPRGWKLDWIFSGAANKSHIVEVYNAFGLTILSVVHAQQLMLGTNDTGSRSVGEVHDRKARDFTRSIVTSIEEVLNGREERRYEGTVRKLVEANWGRQVAYPKVKITLEPADLPAGEQVNVTATAVREGLVTMTCEVENSIRRLIRLTPIAEDEWAEHQDAKRALQPAQPPAPEEDVDDADADDAGEEDANAKKDGPSKRPAMELQASAQPWAPWREVRASEAKLDFPRLDKWLDAERDRLDVEAKPLVVKALVELLPKVRAAAADGVVRPDEVAGLVPELGDFEALVLRWLRSAAQEGARQVQRELAATSELRAAAGDEQEDERDGLSSDTEELLRVQAKAVVRRTASRLQQQLGDEAIDVLRTGGDVSEVVSRVTSRLVESTELRAAAGAVLTRAWNGGREDAARELGGVSEVELSAMLDRNTCSYCAALDGSRFDFQSSEHDAHVPPLRDCEGGGKCRCVLVYVPAARGAA